MPTVVCPGCSRRIELPIHEVSLPSITCAVCNSLFAPADHLYRPSISFSCPNCQAPYKVPADQAGWKTHCPRCNQRFQIPTPAEHFPAPSSHTVLAPLHPEQPTSIAPPPVQSPVPAVPDDSPAEYATLAPQRRANPASVAGLILAGLVFLAVLGLLMSLSSKARRESSHTSRDSAANDPYAPDCAIIRAWLKNQYGEDVEVVSWGRRNIHRFAQLDDHVT